MNPEVRLQRRVHAAGQFNEQLGRTDGERVAGSLSDGLGLLADLFLTRVHMDVQRKFGMDSMLMPASIVKSEENARLQIEVFQVAEAAGQARLHNYVSGKDEWFTTWLAELRLGEQAHSAIAREQLPRYAARNAEDRRRAFSDVLVRTLPEASRAPLVLYRLFPLAVDIVTSLAFGDHAHALEARRRQESILPGIIDCGDCRGAMLENGDRCSQCGNPVWKFDWLMAE